MSEKIPRSGAIEGHVGSSRSLEQRTQYDDPASSPAFRSLVSDIMDLCAVPDSKRHELECLLSRFIKQEGGFASSEKMLLYSEKRNSGSQKNETGPRSLQLKFFNKICEFVFTGVPIKGEKGKPLMVALVDGQSGDFVTVGPEASAKVEIVALDPDFGGCEGDSWTPEEFKNKIVTKEGNKRLLTGNVVLVLKEGVGYVGTFQFSHTKTWKNKRAYRLGAIAMDDSLQIKIREGFTNSFFVKDHRLDLNKKHHPPNLYDEVWRLVGIARDGAFHQRLSDKEVNINTVEDLLKKLNTDPKKLKDILGKGMSPKMWEALVDHAWTCKVDETLYMYSSECMRETSVLFNMVGKVMGLASGSQYVSFEMLLESEKAHATNLVASAFRQWDKVVAVDDEASFKKKLGPRDNVSPIMESSSGSNILNPLKGYELDLPQPATSFEDKVSVFDESPVVSNIVCPPKSLIMKSSSGSNKMINSPKYCELGFSNPVVSLDDKEFLFDESPSQNIVIFPPKSPVNSATMSLISQENNELDFAPPAFSLDEDTILLGEPPGPSNLICSPKFPIKENCSFLSSEIDELDFSQPFVPSHEIFPACDSVWDMSYNNDRYSQFADLENTFHGHLSYSSQMKDYDNWEVVSMTQSLEEENQDIPLQFCVDDVPLDTMELLNHTKNEGYNARKRYLRNKAKKKWRVLFSVVKWLFVPRKAAGKLPVERTQIKLSSSYQDLQALDLVKPTFDKSKSFQNFDTHAPVLSKNLGTNSEAFHSAVNNILLARSIAAATNIAQKKYMSKREKAQRRWTKLYSVMKWFLVQRKVTKRASSALPVRGPSCSSSPDDMSPLVAVDMCPSQENSTYLACSFTVDKFLQLFNKMCSLQPRDRIAMNKLARRRNAADRDFAKKKWRMLFSIMKWLSVRRSAARVKRPYNKC